MLRYLIALACLIALYMPKVKGQEENADFAKWYAVGFSQGVSPKRQSELHVCCGGGDGTADNRIYGHMLNMNATSPFQAASAMLKISQEFVRILRQTCNPITRSPHSRWVADNITDAVSDGSFGRFADDIMFNQGHFNAYFNEMKRNANAGNPQYAGYMIGLLVGNITHISVFNQSLDEVLSESNDAFQALSYARGFAQGLVPRNKTSEVQSVIKTANHQVSIAVTNTIKGLNASHPFNSTSAVRYLTQLFVQIGDNVGRDRMTPYNKWLLGSVSNSTVNGTFGRWADDVMFNQHVWRPRFNATRTAGLKGNFTGAGYEVGTIVRDIFHWQKQSSSPIKEFLETE